MPDRKFDTSTLNLCAFVMLHIFISGLCFSEMGITINKRIAYLITGFSWKVTGVYILYLCLTSFFSVYLIYYMLANAKNSADKIMFGVLLGGITLTHCAFIIFYLILFADV